MKKSRMFELLNDTTTKDLLYTFVPSYNRPCFAFGQKLLPDFTKEALQKIFIVVREEQANTYYKENKQLIEKGLEFIEIPKGTVTGLGTTRQFILDYAIKNRLPYIMDMDDDVLRLEALFTGRSGKGELCSKHTIKEDRKKDPLLPQKVLQLTGRISREVFKEHPDVLLGNIRQQRFSQQYNYAMTKYWINKCTTPRQTKILNIKGIKRAGIKMPDVFDLHGEDMGFAAEVLQNGYNCFNIPCLCYDVVNCYVDSVVRDPHDLEKNRWLHKLEYDGLMEMEVKNYLKERVHYPDGQYMFGDVDWQKYHKYHGTKPIIEKW